MSKQSNIFYRGDFDSFKVKSLRKSITESVVQFSVEDSSYPRIKIFMSHKHSDLEDLKGVIGFLEKKYNISIYIDGNDSTMPKVTSVKTAEKIKEKINLCDKFILLATNDAIHSIWCNWELGYSDAVKSGKIAIFPMNDTDLSDDDYSGNEYMELYPSIVYRDGTTKYKGSQNYIEKGLYVRNKSESGGYEIEPFEEWLDRR